MKCDVHAQIARSTLLYKNNYLNLMIRKNFGFCNDVAASREKAVCMTKSWPRRFALVKVENGSGTSTDMIYNA